jgi:putative protein kinase ArgK-like GTPase of G3E family
MAAVASSDLVAGVLARNVRAIARLLSRAESGGDEARPALDAGDAGSAARGGRG